MQFRTAFMPLIGINIAVFLLQLFLGSAFTGSFMLVSADIWSRPWILLTSMFLHANLSHLLFNMYALFLFGSILESRIGRQRFLFIYLLSGIVASFLSSFFYQSALGASGAVMGIIGTLIIVMPQLRLLFFFFIPMPLWMAGIVWALMDSYGIFYPSGIGNIAHLVGMGCGLLYGLSLKKQKQSYDRRFGSKRSLAKDDVEEYLRTGRI